jgi:hypothetical protein
MRLGSSTHTAASRKTENLELTWFFTLRTTVCGMRESLRAVDGILSARRSEPVNFEPLEELRENAIAFVRTRWDRLYVNTCFKVLSILSIKCRNWFYWADRAERADTAESKESPEFMRIWGYFLENQRFAKMMAGRIPPSPPETLLLSTT